MEWAYSLLSDILRFLGYPAHNIPKTDIQKVQGLFRHCMAQGWFDDAELMARIYSDYYSSEREYRESVSVDAQKASLYQDLLTQSSVPEHVRAKSLIRCSQLLQESGNIERARDKMSEAKAIYEKQKHVSGVLLIEMDRLALPLPSLSSLQRVAGLEAIKKRLEKSGHWSDALTALQYIYRISIMELSDTKRAEGIYQETLASPGTSQGSISWILWQLEVFRTLQWTGAKTGRSLASVTALYNSLVDSEAPLLREKIAALLSEIYQNLGDQPQAVTWRSRVRHLDKYSVFEEEPFSQRLLTMTSFPKFEEEIMELERAMQELTNRTSDDVPFSIRDISVIRMCNIADIYLNQFQLRGIDSTRKLVDYCFRQVKPLLPRITVTGRHKCTGQMLQSKARLLNIESLFAPPVLETRLTMLRVALAAHEDALRYYQDADLPLLTGFASTQLAICHRLLWRGTGRRPDSASFHEAARLFDEACDLFQRHGAMDAYQTNAQFRLEIWFEHYKVKRSVPSGLWDSCSNWLKSWIGMSVRSSLQRTKGYLEQLEQTIDRQRHDLSFLTPEQALTAKQALRNNEAVQKLYETAIPFYALQEDVDHVWSTIQKSKARSVSDLLGLGVVLPKDLGTRIDKDAKAKALLEEERRLFEGVENELTDNQLQLRIKLDAHRERMKENDTLRELLELREGAPVTIARLRAVTKVLEDQGSKRHIVFADYIIAHEKVSLMAVLSDGIKYFDLGVTVKQIDTWRAKYLQVYEPFNGDDEDNLAALQELNALIEPLSKLSEEGDLLILCASGPLHAVPLHALPLTENSKKSLIDRNPVIYCPSMTVFEQCVTRAHADNQRTSTSAQALLAVYETPNGLGWEDRRAEAYEVFSELVEEIEDARILTGVEVNAERFKVECESAKIVHFLGHCNSGTKNLMQHLELVATDPTARTQPLPNKPDVEHHPTELPIAPFTISDLFATSVYASHFNLIACGSASQVIGQGDEPWGIVTALLCAGATSVGGTMWPIQVGTGETFMRMLYKDEGKTDGKGGIVDLAVAHQNAVKRLKRGPDTREPYHWAAFVLHGAWFYRA